MGEGESRPFPTKGRGGRGACRGVGVHRSPAWPRRLSSPPLPETYLPLSQTRYEVVKKKKADTVCEEIATAIVEKYTDRIGTSKRAWRLQVRVWQGCVAGVLPCIWGGPWPRWHVFSCFECEGLGAAGPRSAPSPVHCHPACPTVWHHLLPHPRRVRDRGREAGGAWLGGSCSWGWERGWAQGLVVRVDLALWAAVAPVQQRLSRPCTHVPSTPATAEAAGRPAVPRRARAPAREVRWMPPRPHSRGTSAGDEEDKEGGSLLGWSTCCDCRRLGPGQALHMVSPPVHPLPPPPPSPSPTGTTTGA